MSTRGSRIVAAFKSLLGKRVNPTRLVGKDKLGNKYFEEYRPNHHRKYSRYYESPIQNDFSKDLIETIEIPPAWHAWLRFRRQDPPTDEELRESEEYFNAQQAQATQKQQNQEKTTDVNQSTTAKRTHPKLSSER